MSLLSVPFVIKQRKTCVICFFSALLYNIFGVQYSPFLKVIQFLKLKSFLVSLDHLKNHRILLSKQYIYSCKLKNTIPTRVVFLAKVKAVFEMERQIAKQRNKLFFHHKKWDKLLTQEHHLKLP